jgi:plastocyanin
MKRLRPLLIAGLCAVLGFGGAYIVMRRSAPVASDPNLVQVSLLGDRAEPSVVTVKVGQSVQINARDGRSHQLAQAGSGAGTGHAHDSATDVKTKVFAKDEAYRVSFTKAGSYDFYDVENPSTVITIVAYEPKG